MTYRQTDRQIDTNTPATHGKNVSGIMTQHYG